ncbi:MULTISPECIES: carbohydrate ABC transporter permease [Cyanophyceae]|uniref:Sugar ABC transporter permease n=1 Tax=Nodularia spumigena CENA596 TaxID=1819295 RepID=A0A166KYV1_NODSP|nr:MULTISPECIES: sugar ABC transporter permease [Cyanophyceae]MDB9354842.1 sugar ABC transporter permease [Nodularia spumigena CS-587/03]KZL51703.1 sugar ABC transporter permease [Nodularia spumigena CENA596]MDB9304962.1 sugar ABC transporter permease [Nodularia spumigena CS-591/12]MDB9316649.1 sugar ABC transporter permease [Nodularia spumigena CS-590/01A]MDB9321796.1 sugar ABC transporter permease [Nodularia spumigena CS-591/07A]
MPKTDTKSWLDNDTFAAWTFLSPALILLSIFIIWPIAYLFYLSFTTGSFTSTGTTWVGLRNYWRLLLTPDFWQVLGNTIYFTVATVIPSLVIPLALAVLLDKSLALRGLVRSAYFLPSIISLVAAGLGFRWLFQSDGPANAFLDFFGIAPIPWLGSTTWAMPVLIVLSIWKQLGFNMVVFLAGLQAIPPSRYEAAELDGANAWQQFWHVTLPGLQPTMIFATVTTAIFTLRSFEQVYVITGGGPLNSTNLLVYYIYQEAFAQFDFGYAAAAATVLLAFTLVFVYLQLQTWGDE